MDGLGHVEVGQDALQGPVGPYVVFMLHFFRSYTQRLEVHDLANCVMCVNK